MLKPSEILENSYITAENKTKISIPKLLILGFFAGLFIAFGAEASNMIAFNLLSNPETFGLGRMVAGAIFPVGLILVVFLGAELWTGNCLMITALLEKKIPLSKMLKNWVFVYIGNFIGAVFLAFCMQFSGLFSVGDDGLAKTTFNIALNKCNISLSSAIILGILCNILVCLAIFMASSSKSAAGKIMAIFLPIYLFVASGFEHSIANMYYITAGLLTFHFNPDLLPITAEINLSNFNIFGFLFHNLLPVTIGNFIGGSFFVGFLTWILYRKKLDK
ncbi:MAG: formate/nitrite transporter family protein [Clostridiales Family XIII bacterium]|jgi:formate/nitrite transporter|nr:formate/nitrite transporter family protein [Clostridiales Family XIII bacterium]